MIALENIQSNSIQCTKDVWLSGVNILMKIYIKIK